MGTLTINGLQILEILPLNSNINYINEKKKICYRIKTFINSLLLLLGYSLISRLATNNEINKQ